VKPSDAPPPAAGRAAVGARLRSFRDAIRGLWSLVRDEPNARIHGFATLAVIAAGAGLGIRAGDWRWLTVAITMVWVAEALNTALERLCDATVPEPHRLIRDAKDIAAAAVLLSAAGAAIIGILVLAPYLIAWAARP